MPQDRVSDQGLHCFALNAEISIKPCNDTRKNYLLLEIDQSKELWQKSPLGLKWLTVHFVVGNSGK